MLVKTLAHARAVFKRFSKHPWVVADTETKSVDPAFPDDALTFGRMRIFIFSMCFKGESYSFACSRMSPDYPTLQEYIDTPEFKAIAAKVRIVFHNANYDLMAFRASAPNLVLRNVYCSMIGAWMASPGREQGLKPRAPLYGRHLHKTSTVNFDDEDDVSVYAEEDVILADEVYQMQQFGVVERAPYIFHVCADGKIRKTPNRMPAGKVKIPSETLDSFMKLFLRIQEFPYLKATFRAECHGFPTSLEKLKAIRASVEKAKDDALKDLYRMAGKVFNPNSGPQKSAIMKSLGISSPFKTRKGAESLASASLVKMQMMGHNHPFIVALQTYSSMDKLSKYTCLKKGLPHYVSSKGRIHATAKTVGAVTGRGSCSNPNLQQIPSRKDVFGIKNAFEAPKGQKLIVLDHAGLELRVMALLAQESRMADALNDPKRDIHGETASAFSVDRDPTAKQINFLLQYAGTAWALAEKLTIEGVPTSPKQAQVYCDIYARERPNVLAYRQGLLLSHEKRGYIELLTGRRRSLTQLVRWDKDSDRHRAETTLSNNVVQGSGQDLLKAAVVRTDWNCINPDQRVLDNVPNLRPAFKAYLRDRVRENEKVRKLFKKYSVRFILQVHDELVYCADAHAADECAHRLATVMCRKHFFPSIVPYNTLLRVEGGVDDTWKLAKGKNAAIHVDVMSDY